MLLRTPTARLLHTTQKNTRVSRRLVAMAQQQPVYDIAVKGFPETNTLADCE